MATIASRLLRWQPAMALFVCVLLPVFSLVANAQTPPAAPPTAPPPASATKAPVPACGADIPPSLPAGNLQLTVKIEPSTIWQPARGQVKFTIQGTGFSLDASSIITCFRWSQTEKGKAVEQKNTGWAKSPSLTVIEIGVGKITLAATVPDDIPDPERWWQHVIPTGHRVHSGTWSTVPQADFRVMATSQASWSPLDIVLPVGITSVNFSLLIAGVFIAVACLVLYLVANGRGVPGRNFLLKMISTSRGYASLSQLQIILWTLVVGAGAIYVMALSGNLIDIAQGTLILLGITGLATVGSKLQSHQETQAAATAPVPTPTPPPGQVTGLAVNGEPGPSDASLSWALPADGGRPSTYAVQYQRPGAANWTTASDTITSPRLRVVGLTPGTAYDFKVFASNAAGSGPESAVTRVTTAAAGAPAPAGVPGPVTGLTARSSPTGPDVELSWTAPGAAPAHYTVQYRLHDSDEVWRDADKNVARTNFTATGLRPGSYYDFRVIARNAIGDGPASTIGHATTGPHVPAWSDLVYSERQIDVTRVQMLFFTVISAIFVGLKVLTSGEIPDIPPGYLLLMGISNGVYLTAKFVPDGAGARPAGS